MLTVEDCIGLCDLTRDEIAAIAEHEHVPEIVAAEMGAYLVTLPDGERRLKRMILDDIAESEARGDFKHALKLKLVLHHFVETHREMAGLASADD